MSTSRVPNRFYRVTKANRCTVCGHDTWCVFSQNVAICMRVQSPKEKQFKGGEVGWIHELSGATYVPQEKPKERPVSINVTALLKDWRQHNRELDMKRLAASLSVSYASLSALECVKAPWHRAWGFPMQDGYGNYIGIRIRNEEGQKWAQPGSHAGIFLPKLPAPKMAVIVEGPTDAAAALTMGFYPIGRPSCSGGVTHIVDVTKRLQIQAACIICDNDDPGVRGAADLQKWLRIPSCMLVLPTKDLREFSSIGNKSTIDEMIKQLVWTQPKDPT